eukprot:PhM_4_TR10097/c0_g2_i1/m.19592/K02355/fusA, GFM, EFG; elongation factor G
MFYRCRIVFSFGAGGVNSARRSASTAPTNALHVPITHVRNIGIVAHIDAGKTTTTERMLYYSGSQKRIGEVDKGTTTTDYMEEEMARGITITAAAVTFPWKDHIINLIDTPGHVDFTMEVERSLRVLDGVVAVFDGAVGVQGQSHTVLRQARKHNIPVIAFINKMDKSNSNFDLSVSSIRKKLGVFAAPLQIPIGEGQAGFEGVVDVLEGKSIRWKEPRGLSMVSTPVENELEDMTETVRKARHELIEELLKRDETLLGILMELMELHGDLSEEQLRNKLPLDDVRAAIKRQCNNTSAEIPFVPVLVGASRRDLGVQPLLDAVLQYLPSPIERPMIDVVTESSKTALTVHPQGGTYKGAAALVFKVQHWVDTKGKAGLLAFFRVYSGTIKKARYYNSSRSQTENIASVHIMQGDTMKAVDSIPAGSIGAALTTTVFTGDTLITDQQQKDPFTLPSIDVPTPVVGRIVEAFETSQLQSLTSALKTMCREDPSLSLRETQTGDTVLQGMGELHLEIILSRLQRQFSLSCDLHPPIIEYRETISQPFSIKKFIVKDMTGIPTLSFNATITPKYLQETEGDVEQLQPTSCSVSLELDPELILKDFMVTMDRKDATRATERTLQQSKQLLPYIQEGAKMALGNSPRLHVDLVGAHLTITHMSFLGGKLLGHEVSGAVSQMVARLLRDAGTVTVEPFMYMEITLSDVAFLGDITKDLNERPALSVMNNDEGNGVNVVIAMRHLKNYNSEIRRLAKGHAQFWYKLHHYRLQERRS